MNYVERFLPDLLIFSWTCTKMFDRSCREILNLVSTFLSDDKKANWDTSIFLKNKRKLVEWNFYFNETERQYILNTKL